MPLPDSNIPWPPPHVAELAPKWAEWSAWYSGNTTALADVYGPTLTGERPSRGGLLASIGRLGSDFFWGRRRANLLKPAERRVHVPVAADLCQASADLLLSEPPEVAVVEPEPVTDADGNETPAPGNEARAALADRLEELTGADFHQALIAGAEVAAALGGCYLRVSWDDDVVPGRPFLTITDQDQAAPEFAYGRLTAVTFWTVVHQDGQRVWRHLERHETDPATGHGIIRHALYEGNSEYLGTLRPLTDHPSTAGIAEALTDEDYIDTGSEGLAVIPWPNATPNRTWRRHPIGRHLGRSDLDGLEGILDALDETYTNLQRDIRLGRAMLVVPRTMVEHNGPGRGVSFEQDEVYSPVTAAPGQADQARLPIEQVQFDIRVQEHEQAIALLWNTLIRSAGYSAQTFGEGDTTAMTATEVAARERRSSLSKKRKSRTLVPALEQAVRKLLAVDAVVFGSGVDPTLEVEVALADGIEEDAKYLAEVAGLLESAVAASIETRVRLVNRDKPEEWIAAEVERIKSENGLALADPLTVGLDGADLDASFPPDPDPEEGAPEAPEPDPVAPPIP